MSVKSETPNLDYLKEQVKQLKDLLDDPHPGLYTWSTAYAEQMKKIVNFWNSVSN